MRKILLMIFLGFIFVLSFFNCARAETASGKLIELYLHDKSCDNVYDCESPFYYKIAAKGSESVSSLLEAIDNQDPLYVEHRWAFIYLLGMIGDSKAYPALRAISVENKNHENKERQKSTKWRLTISLGACLGDENIVDFVNLAVQDATDGALQALVEMSGQDFGRNKEQWVEYFKAADHLESFRAACRQRSAPIHG